MSLPAETGAGRHDGEDVLGLLGGQVGVAQVAVRHRVHNPAQHLLSQPAYTSVKTAILEVFDLTGLSVRGLLPRS